MKTAMRMYSEAAVIGTQERVAEVALVENTNRIGGGGAVYK
jgi:hypothetical protein